MTLFASRRSAAAAGLIASRRTAREARAPRTAAALILALTVLLVAAVVWAARTELQEIARAEGEIMPAGRLVYVEHFDGGIVDAVAVRAGSLVARGQVLARLQSPDLGRRAAELAGDRALLEGRMRDLVALIDAGLPRPDEGRHATARRDHHETRVAMLRDRADAQAEALGIARDASMLAAERLRHGEEDFARIETLHRRGLISTAVLRSREDLLQAQRGDRLAAQSDLARAMGGAADAETAVTETVLAYRREIEQEIFDLGQEIARADARIAELAARRGRLVVTAPTDGRVQAVLATTPGEVIAPGERLFEILPSGEALIAEIRLMPNDIGHVAVGDAVTLKPTTFDARRYGTLAGRIATISPTSSIDPEGRPYFTADVALDATRLGRGPYEGRIGAGMIVLAEMQTGRRTVLQYLLKPIDQSLAISMTER